MNHIVLRKTPLKMAKTGMECFVRSAGPIFERLGYKRFQFLFP